MIILHWGILMLLVIVMPFLLGMIPVSNMEDKRKTPTMVYMSGWFVSFSVFEVVAIPFILLEKSFSVLVWTYSLVIGVLILLSAWKYGHCILEIWKNSFLRRNIVDKNRNIFVLLGWVFFAVILGIKIYMAFFYEYYDGDDSYYLAVATIADRYDTMYLRDAYTCYNYDLDIRHALAPIPIFQAWMARISGIHVTVICHSVLSIVWLCLMYCVFVQIARVLFEKKEQYIPVFLILIEVWFLYGNVSISTVETFAMTRTWQGKGLLASTLIPALFLCFLCLYERQISKGIWMLLELVILSCLLASTASLMLVPTLMGLAALLISWQKRELRTLGGMAVSCLPCVVIAAIFFLMR